MVSVVRSASWSSASSGVTERACRGRAGLLAVVAASVSPSSVVFFFLGLGGRFGAASPSTGCFRCLLGLGAAAPSSPSSAVSLVWVARFRGRLAGAFLAVVVDVSSVAAVCAAPSVEGTTSAEGAVAGGVWSWAGVDASLTIASAAGAAVADGGCGRLCVGGSVD